MTEVRNQADENSPLTDAEMIAPYKLPKGWSDIRDWIVASEMSNAEKRRMLRSHDYHKQRLIAELNTGWLIPALLMAALIVFGIAANTDAERTKVSSQASGHERVEPKQEINPPSNGDEQP